MNKIRKVPLMVAGTALITSTLSMGVPIMAHAETGNMAREIEFGRDVILDENVVTDAVIISQIGVANYSLNIVGSAGDYYPRRFVLAYRDYENGYIEKEADALLETLGTGDDGWAIKLVDKKLSDTMKNASIFYRTLKEIGDNRTDILYYGMQYARKVQSDQGTSWEDEWWVRGKINYRNCGHSSLTKTQEVTCVRQEKGDGTVVYLPHDAKTLKALDVPENDEIMKWDDEWSAILQDYYSEANGKLLALDQTLTGGEQVLNEHEATLRRLELILSKMDDKLGLQDSIAALKPTLTHIHQFYDQAGQSGAVDEAELTKLQQEIERMRTQNQQLEQTKTTLTEEKGRLEREKTGLKSQVEALRDENGELQLQLGILRGENEKLKEENTAIAGERDQLTDEKRALEAEIERLKLALAGDAAALLEENQALQSKNEQLTSENINLRTQLAEQEEQMKQLEHQGQANCPAIKTEKLVDNQKMTGVKPENIVTNQNNVAVGSAQQGSELQTAPAETLDPKNPEQKVEKSDETDVEVPMLGEEIKGDWNWWWVIIPLVGALSSFIWWLESKSRR